MSLSGELSEQHSLDCCWCCAQKFGLCVRFIDFYKRIKLREKEKREKTVERKRKRERNKHETPDQFQRAHYFDSSDHTAAAAAAAAADALLSRASRTGEDSQQCECVSL